jgi:hypothetical protein
MSKNIKNIIPLICLMAIAIAGCHSLAVDTNCPTSGYTVSPSAFTLPAEGRSRQPITITIPAGHMNGDSTVELTISNGAFIFNGGAPVSRLVINYAQVKDNTYTLYVRAGSVADANVSIIMRSQCGIVARVPAQYVLSATPALFASAKFTIVTDSSKAVNSPFIRMGIITDPSLYGSIINLQPAAGFTVTPNAVRIDTFGHSGYFILSANANANPNTTTSLTATLGTSNFSRDTLIGFYNIQALLAAAASSVTFTASSDSITSNGINADTLTFQSHLPQLSGYPISFTTSNGRLLFSAGATSSSPTPLLINMNNNGAATVYLMPDTGHVGEIYVRAQYYGSAYYKDLVIKSGYQ